MHRNDGARFRFVHDHGAVGTALCFHTEPQLTAHRHTRSGRAAATAAAAEKIPRGLVLVCAAVGAHRMTPPPAQAEAATHAVAAIVRQGGRQREPASNVTPAATCAAGVAEVQL